MDQPRHRERLGKQVLSGVWAGAAGRELVEGRRVPVVELRELRRAFDGPADESLCLPAAQAIEDADSNLRESRAASDADEV